MASVYRLLLASRTCTVADVADRLGLPEKDVCVLIERLEDLELVHRPSPEDVPLPVNPALGLRDLLDRQKHELQRRQRAVGRYEAELVEMLNTYSRVHGDVAPHPSEHLVGLEAVRRRIEELAATVSFECLTFNPGGAQSPQGLARSKPLDEMTIGRGVQMHTVYLDSLRNDSVTAKYAKWLTNLGGRVRTVPSLPLRMIIFDRSTVITPIDPENTHKGAIQLTEPAVVVGLLDLFHRVWASATPLGDEQERDGRGLLTGQEQELLHLLSGGLTDEAAAKRLGLSPRTTRRMMADLMERLGARSRFEAGMQAARREWV
jgi:DNA-binding CsgD family transcriptional regulator/sugar-specific transcriptional regulator TrmB